VEWRGSVVATQRRWRTTKYVGQVEERRPWFLFGVGVIAIVVVDIRDTHPVIDMHDR
jgi:hypothetical protein